MLFTNYLYATCFGHFVFDIPVRYRLIVVWRAFAGFAGAQGIITATMLMPVSTASVIFFTIPIWTTFYACCLLKEKITKFDVI